MYIEKSQDNNNQRLLAKTIEKVLDEQGVVNYRQNDDESLEVFTETRDDHLQFLMDKLNEGYQEYKHKHPDFARVVQQQEGKPEPKDDWYIDHCLFCGEYLPYGVDLCSECGRLHRTKIGFDADNIPHIVSKSCGQNYLYLKQFIMKIGVLFVAGEGKDELHRRKKRPHTILIISEFLHCY